MKYTLITKLKTSIYSKANNMHFSLQKLKKKKKTPSAAQLKERKKEKLYNN